MVLHYLGPKGSGPARLLALLLGLLLLAGCGGSDQNFVHTGDSNIPVNQGSLAGKFNLGVEVSGVTVQALAPGGGILGQATTDASGNFLIPNFTAPSDFKVVGTLGAHEFSSEVRGYAGGGETFVSINVPTTLVSRLVEERGLSYEQAQATLVQILDYPADRKITGFVSDTANTPFSHLAFFARAAQNGGFEAFADELLEQTGPHRPFHLDLKVMAADLSGLDPALTQLLGKISSDTRLATRLLAKPATPLEVQMRRISDARTVPPFLPEVGQQSDLEVLPQNRLVLGRITSSIAGYAEEVLRDTATEVVIDIGWTHIADALNINYGTSHMLEVIQDELTNVQDGIANLDTAMATYNLEQASNAVGDEVSEILVLATNLYGPDTAGVAADETPYEPSTALKNNVLTPLINFVADTALTTIRGEMIDSQGTHILTSNRDNVYGSQVLNTNRAANAAYAPWRSDNIVARVQTPFQYYGGVQALGAYVEGEAAHLSGDPVTAMNSAVTKSNGYFNSLKAQRGQLPGQLPSDDVVVDLQAGLMWYRKVQASNGGHANAANFASNFKLEVNGTTYGGWHVPSELELDSLQDRARFVAISERDTSLPKDEDDVGYGDYDPATQGLTALGFDPDSVRMLDGNGRSLTVKWDWDDPSFFSDGGWSTNSGVYYFNDKDTFNSGDANLPFFLVRTIGPPTQRYSDADKGQSPFPIENPTAVDYACLGYAQSILSAGFIGANAGATMTFTINTGGDFTMGNQDEGVTESYDLHTFSYNGSVDSTTTTDFPVNLNTLLWFESSNPAVLEFDSENKLHWHTDSSGSQSIPVTAKIRNASGNNSSATMSGSTTIGTTPPVRQLQKVQMFPRNRLYSFSGDGGQVQTENYLCAGYYSDGSVKDLSSSATFTVTQANGQPSQSAEFNGRELSVEGIAQETLTITVSAGGFTDTTSAAVTIGAPVITNLTPGSGPIAGGNQVVINGSLLGGVNRVTVNGVDVSFVANTSSEVTITMPPSSAVGTVDVYVYNPGGQSNRAQYQYQ